MLYAHTPAATGEWHELGDHLAAVADFAAANAAAFGGADLAHLAGSVHDIGKSSKAFQDYLLACHREPGQRHRSVDHKGAGVRAVLQCRPELAFLIQGHHGGLPDKDKLATRIKELPRDEIVNDGYAAAAAAGLLPSDDDAASELALPPYLLNERGGIVRANLAFFLRMCFSALVDADHLDTERHGSPERAAQRGNTPRLAELAEQLAQAQARFPQPGAGASERERAVAAVRDEVYRACLTAAGRAPGFFRLTVPCGGGKTRSSLAFALNHALAHGLERVIVAVPYLTITDQTAADFRGTLGDDRAVLEHHSGAGHPNPNNPAERADAERGADSPAEIWRKLATQDWDAPVIVTTTVQLFESLFGRKPSSCRKLHRIARSVVILDEAQTLPTTLLAPILESLRQLVAYAGTSVVLCTATQPALDDAPGFRGLPGVREIAPDPSRLFSTLKRVTYAWPKPNERRTWAEVADMLRDARQTLAIVNTRADALALLAALGDEPDAFHLSTLLCGAHRRDTLAVIRRRLGEGRPCRVISTQVVEAGVDLDFPLVLRAMGPLDRIVQAAGRANREGRRDTGRVIVFDPAEARRLPRGPYQTGTDRTRVMLAQGNLDLDHPETFPAYFRRFYRDVASLDAYDICSLQEQLQFEEVATKFRMIDEDSVSVVVPYKGLRDDLRDELPDELGEIDHRQRVAELLKELRAARDGAGPARAQDLFARAQPYTVARRRREWEEDAREGNVEELVGDLWGWGPRYDELRGLTTERPPEDFFV